MKKYQFIKEDTIHLGSSTLTRICGVKGSPFEGEIGGYIESAQNLSQEGLAWVGDQSRVWGDARVYGDAQVMGASRVFGGAQIFGQALIDDHAQVFGCAQVFGRARVTGQAQVGDFAWVCGFAVINDVARVLENAQVYADACVGGTETLRGDARRDGGAKVRNLFGYRHSREVLREMRAGPTRA
jgi:hypothetical protein